MTSPSQWPSALSDSDFDRLRYLVESHLGVRMPPNKRAMLQTRISRRLDELGIEDAHTYCNYLFGAGGAAGELDHFFDATTTNVTSFFREHIQLERFGAAILDGLLADANAARRALSLWSAACSSGEEVWTLGILAEEARARGHACAEPRLFGTDISTRVLARATTGVYDATHLDKVPEALRARYFLRSKDRARVRITPELRARATFVRQNLMASTYAVPHDQDAAFLRNVLIYFDRPTQEQVVRRVAGQVRRGGVVAIGIAESIHGFDVPLTHLGLSIYRKGG
jgi:chemotaxis protein methyltransferase CheR